MVCIKPHTRKRSKQNVKENTKSPITGRWGLDSIACENSEMLSTTRDKWVGDTDASEMPTQDGSTQEVSEKIAAIVGDLVFHNGGLLEDHGVKTEDLYAVSS